MNKIQGIILDVDGVIVGEKIGFNSPNPHIDVISKLKELRNKGISISLCTAKPHFSIGTIIKDAGLNNYLLYKIQYKYYCQHTSLKLI